MFDKLQFKGFCRNSVECIIPLSCQLGSFAAYENFFPILSNLHYWRLKLNENSAALINLLNLSIYLDLLYFTIILRFWYEIVYPIASVPCEISRQLIRQSLAVYIFYDLNRESFDCSWD